MLLLFNNDAVFWLLFLACSPTFIYTIFLDRYSIQVLKNAVHWKPTPNVEVFGSTHSISKAHTEYSNSQTHTRIREYDFNLPRPEGTKIPIKIISVKMRISLTEISWRSKHDCVNYFFLLKSSHFVKTWEATHVHIFTCTPTIWNTKKTMCTWKTKREPAGGKKKKHAKKKTNVLLSRLLSCG